MVLGGLRSEFLNQWLAGLQPQLSLETGPDGQIWINSRVAAGDVPIRALVVRRHAAEAPGCCQAEEAVQRPSALPPWPVLSTPSPTKSSCWS